ncbi:four helix bundle protein [Algoriphagus iocasae]|jgi:four helix bundle protein|uniref:Four helix bundle protein n=1 Tax=Algoriphagus iocasae TaxID=1836499 RepID=A0A841MCH9_9BACT|nr:four helix bundle protein [Algoriphagus iocasae]MBB6325020.1 four helix bundle protein [Algoriphagus iocasae]
MESKSKYIPLKELDIYQLSRKLSSKAWNIYQRLDYHLRKNWGDQMISSIDSVGANIAEGYARFHFLDRIKFYYIARASLSESVEHWIDLGLERKIVLQEEFEEIYSISKNLQIKLNRQIKTSYDAKKQV